MKVLHKTKHPYIVKVEGVCGGKPVVSGTRIPVWIIAGWLKQGYAPEQIKNEIYPTLSLAEIYHALSFYYENQEEIEQDIRYNNPSEEELARRARRWKKLSSLRSIDHEKGLL
ncbi:hypothetical protein HKBW3S42_00631 [Candidatus Hakubella thermalkaliphila]|uniref:DUF433 domain-containing protein n=1 Tax=Candidatus Hakubella thermalkaliphila TaxID=2754717 RepID=A0A6V8PI10_9ACTN|nr:hypothetical protein HKBW3S42_00631 [Candidatus Hakubella thermalkaliphila]